MEDKPDKEGLTVTRAPHYTSSLIEDLVTGRQTMKDVMFGVVRTAGPRGLRPVDVHRRMTKLVGEWSVPHLRTVTRWMNEDDRIWKPTGFGTYAAKPNFSKETN